MNATRSSAGRPLRNGWELKGRVAFCAGGCGLVVEATRDYVDGPVFCLYCDACRPGRSCYCDVCRLTNPMPDLEGMPF